MTLGDASLFLTREKSWNGKYYTRYTISMECKDEVFMSRFTMALARIVKKPVNYRPVTRTNFSTSTIKGLPKDYCFNGFTMRIRSKPLVSQLIADRQALREGTVSYPSDECLAIISGMVDSDGYVTVDGHVVVRTRETTALSALCRATGMPFRAYDIPGQSAPEIHLRRNSVALIDTFKKRKPRRSKAA
ncbi:hypothetical protein FHR83_006705 [Actinoplanes campanulatus]|uniref:DOD-type homing endonuclease domain-containing protein n=1 Tax=Actinoplanes campanulatus TaxID=113559 RepID=A0A7W5ANF7_9ACTN|nr:hypothetical protein [Actinoplanes campanulatus]MBB3098999.1 hypothetical protein [Actinoplanes campanulatus]